MAKHKIRQTVSINKNNDLNQITNGSTKVKKFTIFKIRYYNFDDLGLIIIFERK